MTELDILEQYLINHNYNYDRHSLNGGEQIVVFIGNTDVWDFDVVCGPYTYGGSLGELELMGNYVKSEEDIVEGFLTAQDIIERIENE